jgi:hypothetical protein
MKLFTIMFLIGFVAVPGVLAQAPTTIDNSVVRIVFDHNKGGINELIYRSGSNRNVLDPYWNNGGLGRLAYLGEPGQDETGTVVTDYDVQADHATFTYSNALYGTKSFAISWSASDGIEIVMTFILSGTDDRRETRGVWEPGGNNDGNDYITVLKSDETEQTFHYGYPGPWTLIWEGNAYGTKMWDADYDERIGYRSDCYLSTRFANGASADGPYQLMDQAGTYAIHFAVKNSSAFDSWFNSFTNTGQPCSTTDQEGPQVAINADFWRDQDLPVVFCGLKATDEGHGNSLISGAEFFVNSTNSDPGEGYGTALDAYDGTFDELTEDLEVLRLPLHEYSNNTDYILYVRAVDQHDNWGEPATVRFRTNSSGFDPMADEFNFENWGVDWSEHVGYCSGMAWANEFLWRNGLDIEDNDIPLDNPDPDCPNTTAVPPLTSQTRLLIEVAQWLFAPVAVIEKEAIHQAWSFNASNWIRNQFEQTRLMNDDGLNSIIYLMNPGIGHGHAVLGYRTAELGDNLRAIFVYDPNFPNRCGQLDQGIILEKSGDTWSLADTQHDPPHAYSTIGSFFEQFGVSLFWAAFDEIGLILASCPVDLEVTTTLGDYVTKDSTSDEDFVYSVTPYFGDTFDSTHTVVYFGMEYPRAEYNIAVIPHDTAEAESEFSLIFFVQGTVHVIADRCQIKDIPPSGYTFSLTREVALDIRPGVCPNELRLDPAPPDPEKGDEQEIEPDYGLQKLSPGGLDPRTGLPAAILGTPDFDVADIDPSTVALEGVPAVLCQIYDVAMPVGEDAEECECISVGRDRIPDLAVWFENNSVYSALGDVSNGDMLQLEITGQLTDGTPFAGHDCVVIVEDNVSPAAFAGPSTEPELTGNSPNPFNPVTEISFDLPAASDVELEIYNIMGQKVTTLIDRYLEAGRHTVTWDAASVASGVYLYRLRVGDFVETKKMVLLK